MMMQLKRNQPGLEILLSKESVPVYGPDWRSEKYNSVGLQQGYKTLMVKVGQRTVHKLHLSAFSYRLCKLYTESQVYWLIGFSMDVENMQEKNNNTVDVLSRFYHQRSLQFPFLAAMY